MGDLISLDQARHRFEQRDRARVLAAPAHPSLRWVAGATYWIAHRRDTEEGGAWCGADGDLTLAPPGVPLCVDCYPSRAGG